MRALSDHLAGGDWPRVGDDPTPELVASGELAEQIAFRERLRRELDATEARIRELEATATGDASDDSNVGDG